ncbi:SDR family NAD(P)-dependent oxidoreductase [Alkalibacter saccharofermentans]|uniref:3-oxoacyl-[acyl-carrier protein] reductase n=1 Tax=Alkalibacter saccharofermentans DSM 14828 TaxID=1120975 RepID=A0A1M5A2C5_9FIRM|nr:glucose 1-dehydrogenase [Alkalibacter saccharofermentans]SHF23962.1 3-oxoacyl-[acyl-carrier protein] reductase [Alkalibacter saccharofermentans DSM 14828]
MLLKKRVALITGGAMGIGKAIAVDMAKEGAKVVIADISEEAGNSAVAEIKSAGGDAYFVKANVTDMEGLNNAAKEVEDKVGGVDILVINAGISIKKPLDEVDEALWDKIVDINLKGSFLTLKAFVDQVRKSKYGKVIFITSGSALTGTGGGIHYAASKAGQNAMVLNLAKELGPLGINVNAIAPRVIQTEILDHLYPDEESRKKLIEQIPIRKIGQPEDIAYMASFLASDKASYINGQILLLDGGRTHQ